VEHRINQINVNFESYDFCSKLQCTFSVWKHMIDPHNYLVKFILCDSAYQMNASCFTRGSKSCLWSNVLKNLCYKKRNQWAEVLSVAIWFLILIFWKKINHEVTFSAMTCISNILLVFKIQWFKLSLYYHYIRSYNNYNIFLPWRFGFGKGTLVCGAKTSWRSPGGNWWQFFATL
jgi:hypothetical protein